MERAPIPPFNRESAITKVRMAEDAWNGRDPVKVSMAYTEDSSSPFHVLWWVVGFPLATAAVAALRFARDSHDFILTGIAWLLLGVSTLVIGGLLLRTVVGFVRGETGMLSD